MNDTPHILFNRKDQEAPEEMVKQLPDCPYAEQRHIFTAVRLTAFGLGGLSAAQNIAFLTEHTDTILTHRAKNIL